MGAAERLLELYNEVSRHSHYQKLASNFSGIIDEKDLPNYSRYENERLAYIRRYVEFKEQKVLEIGGNTGFFSFEAINHGALSVDFCEGNPTHCEFVKYAAKLFGLENKIRVNQRYFDFKEKPNETYDVVIFLNVMHHLGYDFDDRKINKDIAKERMLQDINAMSAYARSLIFQIGFNWKGDITECLFTHGTKAEMIEWLRLGTKDYWNIERIGVAEGEKRNAWYEDCNDKNVARRDELGEFLNRPIFIMKSKIL